MTEFTPVAAIIGGILIGLSAVALMMTAGRVAGLTGIVSGVILPQGRDWLWRAAFLAGAICAPLLYLAITRQPIEFAAPVGTGAMIAGGLIVGIGVTFGNGCTSGHGVCGIARLSPRSITATAVFMASTFVTVFIVRHVVGL